MEFGREEFFRKGPRADVREGPGDLLKLVRVSGHGGEGVDGRFRGLAVALVDLVLAVGARRATAACLGPGAGLRVERAVLALFAEEEEVGYLLVFLFGEGGSGGDVVGLGAGAGVSKDAQVEDSGGGYTRGTARMACRLVRYPSPLSRGRCFVRRFFARWSEGPRARARDLLFRLVQTWLMDWIRGGCHLIRGAIPNIDELRRIVKVIAQGND